MYLILIYLCIIQTILADVKNQLDPLDIPDEFETLLKIQEDNNLTDEDIYGATFIKEWTNFKVVHKKLFKDKRNERIHMMAYLRNKKKITEHNEKYEKGLVTYKMDTNKFADLLFYQFDMFMLNAMTAAMDIRDILNRRKIFPSYRFTPPKGIRVPDTVDWRDKGAVTPVKDQGYCGSCWAFSSTGSLEGQTFMKTGKLVSLSEQNIMDCSLNYGNSGCGGGLEAWAFRYIRDNGGVNTEESYPYNATLGKCRYQKKNNGAVVTGSVDIQPGNEEHLKIAVAVIGPVSVGINAEDFQFYSEGVYSSKTCSKYLLNHSVLIVGYGTDPSGKDYWLVKNSWGNNWGMDGYIKIIRNKNQCGIAQNAIYPLV